MSEQEDAEIVFQPLADHNLSPSSPLRGKINLGYAFFEYELGPKAVENASKFDIVFVGSTWCLDRLKERGITNGQVLIQGVDHSIFYPRPRIPDGKFKIFSGGKFEYRKGQDLVIAAFREFSKSHPDAHLVCSWFNPWPQLILEAACKSPYLNPAKGKNQFEFFHSLLVNAGVPSDRFTILGMLDHIDLAEEIAQTDCGLFPNRCEGGTNLVMMEYAAMGRPVVANGITGHSDVWDSIAVTIPASEDANHWAVQSPTSIANCLECAASAKPKPMPFTWQQTAKTVANAVERLMIAV